MKPTQLFSLSLVAILEYRCCGDDWFKYMNGEGANEATKKFQLENSLKVPKDIYKELMWGYAASITFVDEQVGRVLDAIDRLELWSNLTVILTSDHGMHNGEKGTWVSDDLIMQQHKCDFNSIYGL